MRGMVIRFLAFVFLAESLVAVQMYLPSIRGNEIGLKVTLRFLFLIKVTNMIGIVRN